MSQRRHIAVMVKNLSSGGAEKQAVLLACALSDVYDVHFIIFNGDNVHKKYLDILATAPKVSVAALYGSVFTRFSKLTSYLRESKIEIIFSYLTAANAFASLAARKVGAKAVIGLRNAALPWPKLVADRFLTNRLAAGAISNSYAAKEAFSAKGFVDEKIVVIPNCIEKFSADPQRSHHGQPKIVSVGRFVAQKDYKSAIEAIALTQQLMGKSFSYTIIGYGPLEAQVRKWIDEYGIGDITSVVINPDNIAQYLTESDIYLSTSLFEGTSNAIMEAMDACLPIVCTKAGDNALLVENGANGYVCKVGDVSKLSSSLVQLLKDSALRQEMGKQSKQRLIAGYGIESFTNKYIDYIANLK